MKLASHFFPIVTVTLIAVVFSHAQVAGERPEASRSSASDRLIVKVLSASHDLDLDRRSTFYPFPFAPTDSIAKVYRERLARYSLRLDGWSELDAFRRALAWVGTRWLHHSDNTVPPSVSTLDLLDRAQNGERFTCVEYARLLVDVLTAYGYPARMVGLSKQDIETRPRGARHVAVEAWSTTYHKWVFLDPQWGIVPCLGGEWLTAYELMTTISRGELGSIEFIACDEVCNYYRVSASDHCEHYRSFLASYTGFLDYPYVYEGKVVVMMYICRDSLPLPLTFQGMPMSGIFYTRSWQKAYGSLDQVHTTFFYAGEYSPTNGFSAPEYTVELATTMPWVTRYEVRLDGGQWQTVSGVKFRWKLHQGINVFEVRAIGFNSTSSRIASVKVFWGKPSELSKFTSSQ